MVLVTGINNVNLNININVKFDTRRRQYFIYRLVVYQCPSRIHLSSCEIERSGRFNRIWRRTGE